MPVVTLSSVGSAFLPLNPTAKATTCQVTLTSCSTGTVSLYMTTVDPSASFIGGSTTIVYTLLSCALAVTTSAIGGQSSAGLGTGLTYSVLSPLTGLLLVSTATNGTIY